MMKVKNTVEFYHWSETYDNDSIRLFRSCEDAVDELIRKGLIPSFWEERVAKLDFSASLEQRSLDLW